MASEETVKVTIGMSVSYAINTEHQEEVDTGYTRAEWDAMSEEEQNDAMQINVDAVVGNYLETWWNEVE